jgi:phage/plasmid-like protein (TIGR03299 family)
MSHNLNIANGKTSMFYVGETPWHKLGTRLDNPATSKEAIEAAGLDYTVEKVSLEAVVDLIDHKPVNNHFATVRTDTNDVLGIVGNRYSPIQNKDAFSFFDTLVGQDEAIYHTAGVLGKGERIWILAKLPDYIRIGKDDLVEKYLLLTNSHDGSSLACAKLTPIRVVCQNTLSVALAGSDQEVRIRHTPNAHARLEQAYKLLGLSNVLYHQLEAIFNRMALTHVSDKELVEYVKALIPDNPKVENQLRRDKIRDTILELHESGMGAEMSRGTLWGAYNAIAEYTDHIQRTKDTSAHLRSIWFGSGERFKVRAFALAGSLIRN